MYMAKSIFARTMCLCLAFFAFLPMQFQSTESEVFAVVHCENER